MLPGGPGHLGLEQDERVVELIRFVYESGKPLAAICAAPSILGKMGLLKNKRATCFPGYEKFLEGAETTTDPVVYDAPFITGKGAGTAAAFGFEIVKLLKGTETAEKIRGLMQY